VSRVGGLRERPVWAEMSQKKFVPRLIILPQYPSSNAARRRFSRPPPDGRSVIR
jgi:hypothetical protein